MILKIQERYINVYKFSVVALSIQSPCFPIVISYLMFCSAGDELFYSVSYGQVPVVLALSSSNERVISEIGEVVCAAALENTEKHFLSSFANITSKRFSTWLKKRQYITSRSSSVVLYNLVEDEILANAKILHERFNSERGTYKLKGGSKMKKSWLTSPGFTELEKMGGPEFCAWISECVPAYTFEIDSNRLENVKFEGGRILEENRLGVVLTHAQMVISFFLEFCCLATYVITAR